MSFLKNKKLCMQAQVIFKINSIYENSNMIEINILEFKMHDSYNRRVLALLGEKGKARGAGGGFLPLCDRRESFRATT
jgi:glutamate formiminotransferase